MSVVQVDGKATRGGVKNLPDNADCSWRGASLGFDPGGKGHGKDIERAVVRDMHDVIDRVEADRASGGGWFVGLKVLTAEGRNVCPLSRVGQEPSGHALVI